MRRFSFTTLILLAAACAPEPELEHAVHSSALISDHAVFDPAFGAPACTSAGTGCSSANTLIGRGNDMNAPETNTPNTIYNACLDGFMTSWSKIALDRLSVETLDGTNLEQGKEVLITADIHAWGTFDYLDLYSAEDAVVPEWQYLGTLQAPGTGPAQLTATYILPAATLRQAIRGNHRFDGGMGRPPSLCPQDMYDDADDLIFAVQPNSAGGDTTPPSSAITSPLAGAIVQGTTTVTAVASDDTAVVEVRFLDGSAPIGAAAQAPYTVLWDTSTLPDGAHMLAARAYDAAGNIGSLRSLVYVDNLPPHTALSRPFNNSEVHGVVEIYAWASDIVGVDRVEFLVDGTVIGSDASSPYYVDWDTTGMSGAHQLSARAFDRAGHSTTSNVYTVIVDNTPPTVTVTAPTAAAIVVASVNVAANAADDRRVQRVELYANNELINTISSAPYTAVWDTYRFIDGLYAVTARAFDVAGNMTESPFINVIVDNPFDATYDPVLRAPRCSNVQPRCNSTGSARGRASYGPEPNHPNTINNSCADGTSLSAMSIDRIYIDTHSHGNFAQGQRVSVSVDLWADSWRVSNQKLDLYYAADANNPSWIAIGTVTPYRAGFNVLRREYVLPAGSLQAVRAQFRHGGSASSCTPGDTNDRDDLIFAVAP